MPGPCLDKENEGNIYVVDADTLHWKRTFSPPAGRISAGSSIWKVPISTWYQAETEVSSV